MKKTECQPIRHAWIAQIFKKFQVRYGHKWSSFIDGIEELAVQEWSEQLSGLTGDEIKYGLDTWKEDWPPSSVEFVKCCKQQSGAWQHNTAAYKEYVPRDRQLTHKCDPEKAESAIKHMRKEIGL